MVARNLLGIAAGLALGYAIAALFVFTITDVGVGVAIAATCWMVIGCLRYVEKRRWIRGRDETWCRREVEEILRRTNSWETR